MPRSFTGEERVVAGVRVFLAIAFVAAAWLDPHVRFSPASAARALFGAYLLFGLAVLAVLVLRSISVGGRFAAAVHTADLGFTAALLLLTEAPPDVFLVLFAFVSLAAGYRWSSSVMLVTAALCIVLLVVHTLVIRAGVDDGDGELLPLIVRTSSVAALAVMLGLLLDAQKHARADARTVTRFGELARGPGGLLRAIERACREMLELFDSPRLLLVFENDSKRQAYLWDCERGRTSDTVLTPTELARWEWDTYLFDTCATEWLWDGSTTPDGTRARIWTLDPDRNGTLPNVMDVPLELVQRYGAQSLLAGSAVMGELYGRVFLIDPAVRMGRGRRLRLLRSIVRQAGAELHNVYLSRRLEQTVGERERARVARELHDSTIQALVGIGMKVEHLRLDAQDGRTEPLAEGLARVQALLRNEVAGLRELMQQLRPPQIDPEHLLDYLGDLTERFRRDTGIAARFVSGDGGVAVPSHLCGEIVRIVQEALVNVRKHTTARNVIVSFAAEPDHWMTTVEDDGGGFEFSGRIEDVQIGRSLGAPAIISERVNALGGRLAIESVPGKGARLEIVIPRRPHA